MYTLRPPHVFMHRRVQHNRLALARMERILAAIGNPPVIEVDDTDTDRVLEMAGPPADLPTVGGRARQGLERREADPSFLFNTFVWNKAERSAPKTRFRSSLAQRVAAVMAGVGEDFAFSRREANWTSGGTPYVCQGGWGIHSLKGCPHKCDYCDEGYIVNFMLDLEEFADHVSLLLAQRPEQKLYRYDLFSDSLGFEPEYGASAILSECFAKSSDKYLLYYTKSDNVDHLLDLPHKSNAIFYCTLSTDTVCRLIERGTPSMAQRIEGLRKCQQAGYRVRVGFSPIIPVRNWREEAVDCIEMLAAKVQPETVRLWILSLMTAAETEALIRPELLDPDAVRAMRAAAPHLTELYAQPFPLETRVEIYGHYLEVLNRTSPATPVSLCTETAAVWERLSGKLRMTPDCLYCCCGGRSGAPAVVAP